MKYAVVEPAGMVHRKGLRMRWVLIILGILLLVVGVIWALQGTNILAGSQMSGHRRWIAIGGVLGIVGIVLIIIGARMRRAAG
jgi:uncharacterized integral membrane protein